jgi:hypothetical protein
METNCSLRRAETPDRNRLRHLKMYAAVTAPLIPGFRAAVEVKLERMAAGIGRVGNPVS